MHLIKYPGGSQHQAMLLISFRVAPLAHKQSYGCPVPVKKQYWRTLVDILNEVHIPLYNTSINMSSKRVSIHLKKVIATLLCIRMALNMAQTAIIACTVLSLNVYIYILGLIGTRWYICIYTHFLLQDSSFLFCDYVELYHLCHPYGNTESVLVITGAAIPCNHTYINNINVQSTEADLIHSDLA